MAHFSLLTYHTTNLGDDIQSLAARQYLPRVDACLDRDRLAEYRGPATTLIGNGWFCDDPQLAWPPAPQIRFFVIVSGEERIFDMLTVPLLATDDMYRPVHKVPVGQDALFLSWPRRLV